MNTIETPLGLGKSGFAGDIPLNLAQAAHSGTSWVPERRAASTVAEYVSTMQDDYATFQGHASKGGTLDMLEAEFARYRAGYKARYWAWLQSRTRLVSSMIAGPSNFPARRMAKRGEVSHKRLEEMLSFRARAMAAARFKLRPDLRPIMAGDADAVERLQIKLAKAQAAQARHKSINAAIRRNKKGGTESQVLAIMELGVPEAHARAYLAPDWVGRIGVADYVLTNNGAEIRRMIKRIEHLTAMQAAPVVASEADNGSGITVEDDPPANRVRVIFPGKPSSQVRDALKAAGFRWAPSNGAWQAYRNSQTIEHANSYLA